MKYMQKGRVGGKILRKESVKLESNEREIMGYYESNRYLGFFLRFRDF